MIELKSTFNSNFEIGHNPAEKFRNQQFFEKLNIFYTDTDIFMEQISLNYKRFWLNLMYNI